MSDSGNFTIVSSNGRCSSIFNVQSHVMWPRSMYTGSLCISSKDTKRFLKFLGKTNERIEIQFSEDTIRFECPGTSIEFQLPECIYPKLSLTTHEKYTSSTIVDKQELELTLSKFAVAKGNRLKTDLQIKLDLDSISFYARFYDEVKLEGSGSGVSLETSAMSNWLMDGLGLIEGKNIQICLTDERSPIVMFDPESPNFKYSIRRTTRTNS